MSARGHWKQRSRRVAGGKQGLDEIGSYRQAPLYTRRRGGGVLEAYRSGASTASSGMAGRGSGRTAGAARPGRHCRVAAVFTKGTLLNRMAIGWLTDDERH